MVPNHWTYWVMTFQQDVCQVQVDHICLHPLRFSLQQCNTEPEIMPDYINNSNVPGTLWLLRSTRQQEGTRDREIRKMRKMQRKQTCAQVAGRVVKGQGYCLLWYGQSCKYDVSSWWTTEGRQTRPDVRQAKKRTHTMSQKQIVDRSKVVVFVEVVFAWCFGVIRCDVAWYIAIDRDIISHIMRYHEIRYIEMSHPYPEFWGLISRYRDIVRIPSKHFSIPNTVMNTKLQLGKADIDVL